MSKPWARKVSVAKAGGTVTDTGKASGDSFLPSKHQNQRSKSKNKIPKSVRFELENALVSLCDVWFEEIKPHLVRNNIKVHIDEDMLGSAGGDHEAGMERLPPGAPGCSHLDPGAASDRRRLLSANSVNCCSTLPTASRAPCPRRARRYHQPPPIPPASTATQNQCHNCDVKSAMQPQKYHQSKQQCDRLVPRLCRSRNALSPAYPPRPIRICSPAARSLPRNNDIAIKVRLVQRLLRCGGDPQGGIALTAFYQPQFIKTERRMIKLNKSTQTETPAPLQQQWEPNTNPVKFHRCQATTTFARYRPQDDQTEITVPPLFDDLSVIGEEHDNEVKVLYKSPRLYTSAMNLAINVQKKITDKKLPPWR